MCVCFALIIKHQTIANKSVSGFTIIVHSFSM